MKQRILKQVSALVFCSVVVTFIVVTMALYTQFGQFMQETVKEEADYLRMILDSNEDIHLEAEIENLNFVSRVTLLDANGTVLYDSENDETIMENHGNRPEVMDAQTYGSGEVLRYSDTLNRQTFYYAVQLKDGNILRIARTTDSILVFLQSGIGIMLVILGVVLLFAFYIVQKQTEKLIEPINHLDLEHPLRDVAYEELRPLLVRVDDQNRQIKHQVRELKERHEEYLAITENMKDGLVMATQTEVLSINKAAQILFQVQKEECLRKPISSVSRNKDLINALNRALEGTYNETVLQVRGRSYQLLANPVSISGKIYGAVILVWDVTEKKEAEKLRREFSANVSHELKTPLMSISGYAELIKNGMVQERDIPEFAGRIHQEANRLTALVQDIIQLSKLEDGAQTFPMESVNIYEMTQDIFKDLEHSAKKKGVTMALHGGSAEITGVRHVLYEMLFNLMDNGIKYNVENGWMNVRVWTTLEHIYWQVQDGGIGIAPEEQERVYERFYRVDKSHSRQSDTGGTGLGLSIVKHGAVMHQASITTESQPGKGTTITLAFPKEYIKIS